jgi:hypothetical protein
VSQAFDTWATYLQLVSKKTKNLGIRFPANWKAEIGKIEVWGKNFLRTYLNRKMLCMFIGSCHLIHSGKLKTGGPMVQAGMAKK